MHPGYLGRRVTAAGCQGREEGLPMQVADTSTTGRTLLRARVSQRSCCRLTPAVRQVWCFALLLL